MRQGDIRRGKGRQEEVERNKERARNTETGGYKETGRDEERKVEIEERNGKNEE